MKCSFRHGRAHIKIGTKGGEPGFYEGWASEVVRALVTVTVTVLHRLRSHPRNERASPFLSNAAPAGYPAFSDAGTGTGTGADPVAIAFASDLV
jgi:hypothetical protein